MKKIAVLYHSGVGNTKKVAESIAGLLSKLYIAEIYSVEKLPANFNMKDYAGFVIGFPVIHTHPAARILQFINGIESLPEPKPAYIFATCGLYSANTLRIFAKRCVSKKIIPVVHRVFWGCPASDVSLFAPGLKRAFKFPKNLHMNVMDDVSAFCVKVSRGKIILNMPKFKLYSILNYPNKLAGRLFTFPIYLHKSKCVRCGKCVKDCPAGALQNNSDGYPAFDPKKCEKCYRCIHHCPNLALSLSRKSTPKKVLNQ